MASIDQQRLFESECSSTKVFLLMNHSSNDIGLRITSKPLIKPQKLSVQPLLTARQSSNVKYLSKETCYPLFNDSFFSEKSSGRLNHLPRAHGHSYHSYASTVAARTARNQRKDVTRDRPSWKSLSKDYVDSTFNDDSYHNVNQSSSSIFSTSNLFSKSQYLHSNENFSKSLKFPLKPSEVHEYYGDQLNEIEKCEIFDYEMISYLGLKCEKIRARSIADYDDEHGCYKRIIGDQIAYRYEILSTLGKGSFGLVLKCFDHQKKEFVAIKILKNKKRFQQQGLVEIEILNRLKLLDENNLFNIVHLKEHFVFRQHLCLKFELLGINLYQLIEKNRFQGFTNVLIQRLTFSILQCLLLLFEQQIIHCDLKPENILLREKGTSAIKVIDFGSGCFQSERIYTYIQSRFYRAPEIILGISYTCAIDMWSLACIIVELFTGYPIFPGENEEEQLSMIMEVFDVPPKNLLEQGTRKELFFDAHGHPRCSTLKKRRPGSRPLSSIIRTDDEDLVDFLNQCFSSWNPSTRLTPRDALNHSWLNHPKRFQRVSSKKYLRKKEMNSSQGNTQSYENTLLPRLSYQ